jgi:hypothetical protein
VTVESDRGGQDVAGSWRRDPSTSRPQRQITVSTDPDDNRVLECAGSQTRSLDDDVLGTNPKYDWKRFGDSISTLGQSSSAAFVERRATEEGRGSCAKPLRTRFRTGPTPVLSFTERGTDNRRAISTRNRALNRIRPTTYRNVLPWGNVDMATTATLQREAEELETRRGRRQNGARQSVSLPVGRLMSSSNKL